MSAAALAWRNMAQRGLLTDDGILLLEIVGQPDTFTNGVTAIAVEDLGGTHDRIINDVDACPGLVARVGRIRESALT